MTRDIRNEAIAAGVIRPRAQHAPVELTAVRSPRPVLEIDETGLWSAACDLYATAPPLTVERLIVEGGPIGRHLVTLRRRGRPPRGDYELSPDKRNRF